MTCTSTTTLRRRRLVAAALALPLSLGMTGTALASGSSELRTTAAVAAADPGDKAAPQAAAAAENAAAAKAAEDKAAKDKAAEDKAAKDKAAEDKAAKDKAAADEAAAHKVEQSKSAPKSAPTGSAAGAASGKSAAESTRDASADPDKHGTGTQEPLIKQQPLSGADQTGQGANPGDTCDHTYCSTRDGSPSLNGNGDGEAKGKPCAGCVGKADNKNPPGQEQSDPRGTFPNNGYECDNNNGIGKTNPAHTGCTSTDTDPTTPTCPDGSAMPASGKVADCKKAGGKVKTCPDGSAMPASGEVADCKKAADTGQERLTFCHATGSASNPYVVITTSTSAVVNAHADHQDGRDIIPAFTYKGVSYPAQGDQSLLATGCVPAGTTPVDGSTPGQAGTNPPVKLCPNGQVMPAGDPASCPTAPPVCPTVMPTVGPVMAGCFPTTATPPPAGTLPIDGVTPDQSGTNPVIVPNTAVLPAVLHAPAARPAAAAASRVPSTLPFTGTDAALLVELAALLLLAGGGFLVAARRERLARTGA